MRDCRICAQGVDRFDAEVALNRDGELSRRVLVYGEHSAVHMVHYIHHYALYGSRFIHRIDKVSTLVCYNQYMHKNIIYIFIVVVVLGSVVYLVSKERPRGQEEVQESTSASYSDGVTTVEASFDNENMTVTFSHASTGDLTLPRVVAASGARYANEDESIVFWEHQGDALITKDGEVVFNSGADATLTGRWTWERLVKNDGSEVFPRKDSAFTITFGADRRVSGTTDCNGFSGSYEHPGEGSVAFGALASTKMFCEGSQEAEFTGILSGVGSYVISEDGSELTLMAEEGNMYFKKY